MVEIIRDMMVGLIIIPCSSKLGAISTREDQLVTIDYFSVGDSMKANSRLYSLRVGVSSMSVLQFPL